MPTSLMVISTISNTCSFDRGDVLATTSCPIHLDALRSEVLDDLALLGAKLMVDVVKVCNIFSIKESVSVKHNSLRFNLHPLIRIWIDTWQQKQSKWMKESPTVILL